MDSMVLIILNLVYDNSSSLLHYIYSTETNPFLHIEKEEYLCVLCKSLLIKKSIKEFKSKENGFNYCWKGHKV